MLLGVSGSTAAHQKPQAHAPGSRTATLNALSQIIGVHPVLLDVVPKGVAFHHAGI